jgi:hypothetical protein
VATQPWVPERKPTAKPDQSKHATAVPTGTAEPDCEDRAVVDAKEVVSSENAYVFSEKKQPKTDSKADGESEYEPP